MTRHLSVLVFTLVCTLFVNAPAVYAAGDPELTPAERKYVKRQIRKIAKKIANNKINNLLPLGPDDLAPGAVINEKIGNEAVNATKIAMGAVGSTEIAAGAVGTAALADGAVTAVKLSAALQGGRKYYLTKDGIYDGSEALTACSAGYHMASKWEIRDVTNLRYDTAIGYVADDGGEGPPSDGELGWVRTGFESDDSATAGRANCLVWTTTAGNGTMAALGSSGWDWGVLLTGLCSIELRVWCIEN